MFQSIIKIAVITARKARAKAIAEAAATKQTYKDAMAADITPKPKS